MIIVFELVGNSLYNVIIIKILEGFIVKGYFLFILGWGSMLCFLDLFRSLYFFFYVV